MYIIYIYAYCICNDPGVEDGKSKKNLTHMKTCLNIPYSIYASEGRYLYIYTHTYSHIHINNFCRLDLHVSQHSMSPFLVVISPFGA